MRLDGDLANDLQVESHAAFYATRGRQQWVVIPFTPAQPAATQVECYSGREHQVQPV